LHNQSQPKTAPTDGRVRPSSPCKKLQKPSLSTSSTTPTSAPSTPSALLYSKRTCSSHVDYEQLGVRRFELATFLVRYRIFTSVGPDRALIATGTHRLTSHCSRLEPTLQIPEGHQSGISYRRMCNLHPQWLMEKKRQGAAQLELQANQQRYPKTGYHISGWSWAEEEISRM